MSEDEEIVLQSSELHKYLITHNFDGLYNNEENEVSELCSVGPKVKPYSFMENNKIDDNNENFKYNKPKLCPYTLDVIDKLIKTGLMYPDHVADIEINLNLRHIEPNHFCLANNAVYFAFLASSTAPIAIFHQKLKILNYLSILAGSVYCAFKIYKNVKLFIQKRKIYSFAGALEKLFYASKQALSFLSESEFLVKTKIVKEQLFYIADNGWINSNTSEGLKYSGLVFPELRNVFSEIMLDVIYSFDILTKKLRKLVVLVPNVDSDNNYTELPDFNTLKDISMNLSLENLKKLNSIYLISQSEFLRRFILSFVDNFWVNNSSLNCLKSLINELSIISNKFIVHVSRLQSYYKYFTKVVVNKNSKLERNKMLKVESVNDKVLICLRNFLTKIEAHLLSLSIDFNMLDEWMTEYEENNKETIGYDKKILTIFNDRLLSMRSNIESFVFLYNSNCDILKNMISNNFSDNNADIEPINEEFNERVKKTGVEVGKSDFHFTGGDEVLISLCNTNSTNSNYKSENDDYEEDLMKCLPKNVLLELKCALKGKKEEWIEREKKAVKSNVTIDKLDLDTLSNTIEGNSKVDSSLMKSLRKFSSNRSNQCISESEYSSYDEEDTLTNLKKIMTSTMNDSNSYDEGVSKSTFTECNQLNSDFDSSTLCLNVDKPVDCSVKKCSHNSFTDQIKFAQKSFNLSMKEEEFVDNSSDLFESDDD